MCLSRSKCSDNPDLTKRDRRVTECSVWYKMLLPPPSYQTVVIQCSGFVCAGGLQKPVPHVVSSLCLSEMVESMKKVASMDLELTVEERNLLSVAYKNVIGARRASWRIISSLEQKEENKSGEDKLKMIREYRKTVRNC